MKTRMALATLLLVALAAPVLAQETTGGDQELPYVYTRWKHFTVENGLPDDHIFSIKVDGPRVWVGTEDGLALIDKASGKVTKTWKEEDGLPRSQLHGPGQVDGDIVGRVKVDSGGARADMLTRGNRLFVFTNDGALKAYDVEARN